MARKPLGPIRDSIPISPTGSRSHPSKTPQRNQTLGLGGTLEHFRRRLEMHLRMLLEGIRSMRAN